MQRQNNAPTIQEELEKALTTLLKSPTPIVAAGRTDAGVSAKMMMAHFDSDKELDNLVYRLNRFLPSTIAVQSIRAVLPDAHARFDALYRAYTYYIHFEKNPFLESFSLEFPNALDITKMNICAALLLEYEDFKSFEKMHSDNKTSLCEVIQAEWEIIENQWVFTIKANRFLRNMVRSIVGTLFEVGKGNISIEDFQKIIEKKDRTFAAASAPAKALFLTNIEYSSNLFDVS